MRALLMLGVLCGVAGPAFAQQPASSASASKECWPVTTSQVIVRTDAGMRKGTLLCIGPDAVVLAGSDPLPLSTVLEIRRPRDGVLDGALKGAAVGLVVVALCAGECEAEYLLRATIGYAAIGAVIDSLQGNNKTIYRREPRPSVRFTLRF